MVLNFDGFILQTNQNFEKITVYIPNDVFNFLPHIIG